MNYLTTAKQYHAAGLRVIPVNADKRPTGPWKQYQAEQTVGDIEKLFAADCWGLAILTGINGLEVIDVDEKYDPDHSLFQRYVRLNDEYSSNEVPVTDLCVQATKNGGYHVVYRCAQIEGNQKLAMREATTQEAAEGDTVKVLIETRGTGGYIVAYPTPGYAMEIGVFTDIPAITQRQRFYLFQAARCFNEVIHHSEPDVAQSAMPRPSEGTRPGDDYNSKTNIVDLLLSYGWSYVYEDSTRVHLRRPGNTEAKTSGNYHKELNLFVSHSTSTPFEPEKGYTAFGIYAAMEHGGDCKAAARALGQQGYGDQQRRVKESAPVQKAETSSDAEQPRTDLKKLLSFVYSTRFDIRQPIREEDATLTLEYGKVFKIGGIGMIGGIVGPQKAGKTLVMSCIVASGLDSGERKLGFGMNLKGKKAVFFDTEQSVYFYQRTQERIHHLAGKYNPVEGYEAYNLRRLNVDERVRTIGAILSGRKDLGLVVIDGIVDLCENFNNERDSQRTVEHLMRWSDETRAMFLTVLHLTKAEGYLRGHLGTALQNKYDFGIEIKKDRELEIYNVKCRESRFAPFPDFVFERDEKGFPFIPGAKPFDPSLNGRLTPAPVTKTEIPF